MDLENLDADTPAWVARAAKQVNADIPDLGQSLHDVSGVEKMHQDFSDELGESFVEDVTPMAGAGMTMPHNMVKSSPVTSDVDQETAILETMFPNGIPASSIKKAVFVSSIVKELLLYVNGDYTALENIEILASEQK